MTQLTLIFSKTVQDDGLIQTVDGTQLHKVLEIGTSEVTKWCKRAIVAAQLVEGEDYILSTTNLSSGNINNLAHTYHFTMDAAKEISTMTRSEIGKQVRRYLISVEKEYQAIVEAERLQLANNLKNLVSTGSLSNQAVDKQYYPASEIKNILNLKTGTKVINAVSDYYMVRTIEVGVRTYIHLTDFIKAWDMLKAESELKTVHCKCTYQHTLTGLVFEA